MFFDFPCEGTRRTYCVGGGWVMGGKHVKLAYFVRRNFCQKMAYFRGGNKNIIHFKFLPLRVNFWPQVVDFEPLAVNFITMNVSFMHLRVILVSGSRL